MMTTIDLTRDFFDKHHDDAQWSRVRFEVEHVSGEVVQDRLSQGVHSRKFLQRKPSQDK